MSHTRVFIIRRSGTLVITTTATDKEKPTLITSSSGNADAVAMRYIARQHGMINVVKELA